MGSADTDTWSYLAGEPGRNRVRAFERSRDGTLYLEWYEDDPDTGERKRKRLSLGHRDREKAKDKTDELAGRFAAMDPGAEDHVLTLGELFDIFRSERSPDVSEQRAKVYDRVSEAMCRRFGDGRAVADLNRSDWDAYSRERQQGIIDCRGHRVPEEDREEVSGRIAEKDLQVLRAACNWAVSEDLLETNPTEGYPLPAANTPRRPTMTEERYRKMLEVAAEVGWRFRVTLILCHETGHRSKSVRRLRWSDVEPLEAGEVRWRGGEDKSGHDHQTALTSTAVDALREAREHRPGVGEAWVLPNPVDASRSVTRHQLRRWWLEAEDKAGLEHVDGLGWHALRRKLADDLRDLPLKDLAAAGGWQDEQTVVECYQSADQEAIRGALENRSARGDGVG